MCAYVVGKQGGPIHNCEQRQTKMEWNLSRTCTKLQQCFIDGKQSHMKNMPDHSMETTEAKKSEN